VAQEVEETIVKIMKEAALAGEVDRSRSPSAHNRQGA
jgi:hypothetical protein